MLQVFEPSEIAARYLTADDDLIRATDVPERMQLTTSSLSPSTSLAHSSTYAPFPDSELDAASEWVATRLSSRVYREYILSDGKYHTYFPNLIMALRTALKFLLHDHFEVPYIWSHRRDLISVWEPEKSVARIELLSREELWRVQVLGTRYRALHARRQTLMATYGRMQVADEHFEMDIALSLDSVDSVADAMEWLAMRYKQQHKDALEIEEASVDGQRRKKPSRLSPYDVAKGNIVSQVAQVDFFTQCLLFILIRGALQSFGNVRDMVRRMLSANMQYFVEDKDMPPLLYAEGFVSDVPNATSAEDVLKTARFIVATELGKDPQLRKLVRETFKSKATVTVRPTEKGAVKIDDQHPFAVSILVRFLYSMSDIPLSHSNTS